MDDATVLPPDPRDGYLIRNQVEYYFSDENLPYDKYLLDRSHGPENLPVPIKCVCEFKKMRTYKPYEAVVAALRRSTSLFITEDEGIKRKMPVSEAAMAQARRSKDAAGAVQRSGTKKKKKKTGGGGPTFVPAVRASGNPGMTKGMLKPTGFEEFFADAPMKPEEFEEERGIYLSTSDFPTRIEIAIQRYKSKRKFHQESAHIFNRWLRFGGIDVGQKQFTGNLDQSFLDSYDAAEISLLTATHYVGDKDNPDEWGVDFEGVAKAFLSTQVPTLFFGYKDSEIRACANVMRNFYNYLLHHDVCPEYRTDIEAARRICDIGERELPTILRLGQVLPGQFNVALSALSGGYHQFELQDCQAWDENAKDVDIEETENNFKRIVAKGVAAYEDSNLSQKIRNCLDSTNNNINTPYFQCTGENQVTLEVTEILPSKPLSTETSEASKDSSSPVPNPLGKLKCQTCKLPSFETYDLPSPAKRHQKSQSKQHEYKYKYEYEFLIDNSILADCFIGLKMEATVRKLAAAAAAATGLEYEYEYLDNVRALYCSFYTLLPNDLMMHWKQPEWVTSEKDDLNSIAAAAAAEEEEEEAAMKVY